MITVKELSNNFEIERKYIIKMPDLDLLKNKSDRVLSITQTYLGQNSEGFNCRVRKIIENGKTEYIFTEKRAVSSIKRIENEYKIDENRYNSLIENRLKERNIIEKTRYCVNKNGFTYEIDIYPFWKNQAVMEIELENEQIIPKSLDFIEVLKDVTFDKRFSNFALSKTIPDEILKV